MGQWEWFSGIFRWVPTACSPEMEGSGQRHSCDNGLKDGLSRWTIPGVPNTRVHEGRSPVAEGVNDFLKQAVGSVATSRTLLLVDEPDVVRPEGLLAGQEVG